MVKSSLRSFISALPLATVALSVFLLFSNTASAELLLTIDTTAKKFWLTGTATGQFSGYGGGNATWAYFSNSLWNTNGLVGIPANLVSNSNGAPITRVAIGNSMGGFTFNLFSANLTTTTLTGLGQTGAYDYSGADAGTIAGFESGIGHLANETEGSTFGMLTIQSGSYGPTAIPEPGTWAAAALLAGGAGFMRWRKRAAKA